MSNDDVLKEYEEQHPLRKKPLPLWLNIAYKHKSMFACLSFAFVVLIMMSYLVMKDTKCETYDQLSYWYCLSLTETYKRLQDINQLHLVIRPSVKMHDV